jgi:hypothetical protein
VVHVDQDGAGGDPGYEAALRRGQRRQDDRSRGEVGRLVDHA